MEGDTSPPSRFGRVARALFGLVVVCAMAFVLAAPRPPERIHPARIPVRFWHMWTAEWKVVVDRIVARFNESQDKYEVVALSVPAGSADAKFLLAVVGGEPPDLMAQWNPIIPTWAQSGMLRPLDDLMSPTDKERFLRDAYPIAKKIGVYHDRLYGMAIGVNVWALYYRPQHMRAVGLDPSRLPDSLEELVAWGRRLDQKDASGNLTRLGFLPGWFAMYAPVFGGGFYDWQKQALTLSTPRNLECLSYLTETRKKLGLDVVTRFDSAQNSGFGVEWPFISGAFSITLDGQWRVEQLAKYAADLDYEVAPVPPPAGGRAAAGWSNGNFMVVPSSARQPEGAWEFIRFWSGLADPEAAAEFHTWGGWLPALPAVAKAPAYQSYLEKYPHFRVFLDLMSSENLDATPPVPYQVFLADRILAIDQATARGVLSPQEALDALARDVDLELQRRKELRYDD
jgi:multiple sugar transport system substrate-binding protein